MRAVADRVEYSVAALYKHFADREELVRALCARDFYAFGEVLAARPAREIRRWIRSSACAASPAPTPSSRYSTLSSTA